jgi:hypothetical protein
VGRRWYGKDGRFRRKEVRQFMKEEGRKAMYEGRTTKPWGAAAVVMAGGRGKDTVSVCTAYGRKEGSKNGRKEGRKGTNK